MDQGPSSVFDQALLAKRRARAVRTLAGASFLKVRAVADLADRLEAIRRTFPVAVELGAQGRFLLDELAGRGLLGTKVGALTVTDPEPGFVAGIEAGAVWGWELMRLETASTDRVRRLPALDQ
jgi:hypothetical protein